MMMVALGPGYQVETRSTATRCRESLGLTIGQVDAYLRMQRAIESGRLVGGQDEQDQVKQEEQEQVDQDQEDQDQDQDEQNQGEQDEQEQVDILVDQDEDERDQVEEDVNVGGAKRIKSEAPNQEPVKAFIMNEVPIEIASDSDDEDISEDEAGGVGEGEVAVDELLQAKRVYDELLLKRKRGQKNKLKIYLKREKIGLGEREEEVEAIRREREGKRASLATYRQRMLKLTSPPAPIPVVEVPDVPIKFFFRSFLSYFQVDSIPVAGDRALLDEQ